MSPLVRSKKRPIWQRVIKICFYIYIYIYIYIYVLSFLFQFDDAADIYFFIYYIYIHLHRLAALFVRYRSAWDGILQSRIALSNHTASALRLIDNYR